MKYAWLAVVSICLLSTSYAEDAPQAPQLEVTGVATCKDASKVAAILDDRVARVGDVFEVKADGKLGAKAHVDNPLELGSNMLLIQEITDKGVRVLYVETEKVKMKNPKTGEIVNLILIKYEEQQFIPLKTRPKTSYGLRGPPKKNKQANSD